MMPSTRTHDFDDLALQAKVLQAVQTDFAAESVDFLAAGNESYVYTFMWDDRKMVVKIPKDQVYSNANDPHIDALELLHSEESLLEHVTTQFLRAGLKPITPHPTVASLTAGYPTMVQPYINSDNSKPDDFQLGQLLARIHSIPPPTFRLIAQQELTTSALVTARLTQRWHELQRHVPDLGELPPQSKLSELLVSLDTARSILHMDYRAANFRTQQGMLTGLIDWSNALIGHPALELARVAETGEVGPAFYEGYAAIKIIEPLLPEQERYLRLDTAVMLALVFISEDPDPQRAERAIARVKELVAPDVLKF